MQAKLLLRVDGAGGAKADINAVREALRTLANSGQLSMRELAVATKNARTQIAALRQEARAGVQNAAQSVHNTIQAGRNLVFAAAGGSLAVQAGSSIKDAGIKLDQIQLMLKFSQGATEAGNALNFIREQSDRLGASFPVAAEGFAQISIAAKDTAVSSEDVRQVFMGLLEAQAVMGLSNEALEGSFRAIQQIMSKGQVQAEELRGQLGDRLYGAFQIAARGMGYTTQQLNDLLQRGMVPATQFIPRFAAELRKMVGPEVATLTDRAAASFNRLQNALFFAQANAAKGGFLDALAESAETIAASLGDPNVQQNLAAVAATMGQLVNLVVQNADTILAVMAAIGGARGGAAIGGWLGTMAGGPVGAAAGTAIGGLIGGAGTYALTKSTIVGASTTSASERPAIESVNQLLVQRRDLLQEQALLTNSLGRAGKASADQYSSRLKEVNLQLSGITTKLKGFQGTELPKQIQWKPLNPEKKAPEALPDPFALPDPDRIRAEAQATVALLKARNDAAEAALDAQMKDGLVTLQQYTAERNKLIASSFDAEIAARSRESAALGGAIAQLKAQNNPQATRQAGDLADRKLGVDAEVKVLGIERKAALDAADVDAKQMERDLAAFRRQLNIQTLQAQGRDTEAALAELDANHLEWLRKAGKDAEAADLAGKLFNASKGQIELQKLLTAVQRAQDKYEGARDDITAGRVTGVIGTETEGRSKLRAAKDEYQKTLAEIRAEWEKTRASGTFSAEQIEGFDRALSTAAGKLKAYDSPLRSMLRDWGSQFDNLERASVGWANSALDALTQLVTTGKADFRGFATSVLQEIARIQLAAVASSAISGMSGVMGSVIGAGLSAAFGGGVSSTGTYTSYNGAAGGGYINSKGDVIGPGSDTSDSVASVVPAGSYVLRAAAVRAYGRAELERLLASGKYHAVKLSRGEKVVEPGNVNKLGLRLLDRINNADRYADGGLVGRAAARVQKEVARGGDVNVSVPVTVQGSSGIDEERADRMGRRIEASTRQIVREELNMAQAPRGALSRGGYER
jgi:lambda family phage tail tape measure protein